MFKTKKINIPRPIPIAIKALNREKNARVSLK
jgi:hypothetical protein